jgi:hypothetical protein
MPALFFPEAVLDVQRLVECDVGHADRLAMLVEIMAAAVAARHVDIQRDIGRLRDDMLG